MFVIKFYYFRALFLRQRQFENMRFNYDVILNAMGVAFSQKICYDNTGNVLNKGRNFNTHTIRKMYLIMFRMISRHWFQTKLLLYIA